MGVSSKFTSCVKGSPLTANESSDPLQLSWDSEAKTEATGAAATVSAALGNAKFDICGVGALKESGVTTKLANHCTGASIWFAPAANHDTALASAWDRTTSEPDGAAEPAAGADREIAADASPADAPPANVPAPAVG